MAKRSRLFSRLGTQHSTDVLYYLTNNSFMECLVHHLMNSNCACVSSATLDNFALGQTSLDKKQSSRLHSTRWPNDLDTSLNMHVERCIVKSRERLARALAEGMSDATPPKVFTPIGKSVIFSYHSANSALVFYQV